MGEEQDEMEKQLEGNEEDECVESTPREQERRTEAPETAERVEHPKFVQVTTGKEFLSGP